MTSGSKKGIDQPPCWNPPSRSSSAPPGACTTPSRLMNSLITIRMACRRWHSHELIAAPGPQLRRSEVEPHDHPANGGVADLLEPSGRERAAAADVQLAP